MTNETLPTKWASVWEKWYPQMLLLLEQVTCLEGTPGLDLELTSETCSSRMGHM
jgi:hypothetical protein